MIHLCKDCPDTFDHTEHQLCTVCCKRVPVPLAISEIGFANSTICSSECEKKMGLLVPRRHGKMFTLMEAAKLFPSSILVTATPPKRKKPKKKK